MSDLERLADALRAMDIPLLATIEVVTEQGKERLRMTSSAGVVFKTDAADDLAVWEAEGRRSAALAAAAQRLRAAFEGTLTRSGRQRGRLFPILRNADYLAQAKAALGADPMAHGMMRPFSRSLFLAYAYDFHDRIEPLFTPEDAPFGMTPEELEPQAIDGFATQVAFSGQVGVEPALSSGFWRWRFDGTFDASRMLLLYDWDAVAERLYCDVAELVAVPLVGDVLLFGAIGPQGFESVEQVQHAASALADRVIKGGGSILTTELFALRDDEVVPVG